MDKVAEIKKFFKAKGYAEHQIIGIIANLKRETSTFDHKNNTGDSGTAYGLAQWRGGRQNDFKKLFGKPIQDSTFHEQLEFIDHELNNKESAAGKALKTSKNPSEAITAFAKFERFKGYDDPSDPKYTSMKKYASTLGYDTSSSNSSEDIGSQYTEDDSSSDSFQYEQKKLGKDPEWIEYEKYAEQKGIELNEANFKKFKEDQEKALSENKNNDWNQRINNARTLYESMADGTNKGYDPKTQKGEAFPFLEAATSLAGILNGNQMSETELPKRDEQVSMMFRNYASEVKRLSEIGLKPEDEAYAKNMLAESYQANLDMVSRASNGNRNLILGNLGRLDYQKQQGLLNIALEDGRQKTEALHKYGEAMKYISEFDSKRDIANNEREYQNAMMTKQAGGKLTSDAWANLMNNIQYHKENKPGSANHMLRTHYMREFYGMDPNEKDPNSYYHRDQYAKREKDLMSTKATMQSNINRAAGITDPIQKEAFNKTFEANGSDWSSKNLFLNNDAQKIDPPTIPQVDPNQEAGMNYKIPRAIDTSKIFTDSSNYPTLSSNPISGNGSKIGGDLFGQLEAQANNNNQLATQATSFLEDQNIKIQQTLAEQRKLDEENAKIKELWIGQ